MRFNLNVLCIVYTVYQSYLANIVRPIMNVNLHVIYISSDVKRSCRLNEKRKLFMIKE